MIFFNVYLFWGERKSVSRGGTEREGDTESESGFRLQALSCQHTALRGVLNHKPWDHGLSLSGILN